MAGAGPEFKISGQRKGEIQTLAYFYPFTTTDQNRNARQSGDTLDEVQLHKESLPRFAGHEPPRYALDEGGKKLMWDNADAKAIDEQVSLAKQFGIGFIGLLYAGAQGGKKVLELAEPILRLAESTEAQDVPLGVLACLNLARAKFPIKVDAPNEFGRSLDLSPLSAEAIVDFCVKNLWSRDNYFKINGRPFLSFCAFQIEEHFPREAVLSFVNALRSCAEKAGFDPYIVPIVWDTVPPSNFRGIPVDGFTTYAFLPDFSKKGAPLQDYETLAAKRIQEWETLSKNSPAPFVPSIALGWDATARVEPGLAPCDGAPFYPLTPVVTGTSSEKVRHFAEAQEKFVRAHIPEDEQYRPIFAWNEITEGASLLPKYDSKLRRYTVDLLRQITNTNYAEDDALEPRQMFSAMD